MRLKIRPIRLGLLVNPSNSSEIQTAIELNTSLWGGIYNPLIPVAGRLSKRLKSRHVFVKSGAALANGYLSAYDPDLVVQISDKLPRGLELGHRQIIRATEIWEHISPENNELTPHYGIGSFELLDQVYEDHFRYTERHPITVDFPKIPKKGKLLWSAIFGTYPAKIKDVLERRYKEAIGLKQNVVSPGTYTSLISSRILYPSRITRLYLDKRFRTGSWQFATVFLLDPSVPSDVLEFWNLRALGRNIVPVPTNLLDEDLVLDMVARFVESSYRPHRFNEKLYANVHFIPAHGCPIDRLNEFADAVAKRLTVKTKDNQPPILRHHSYPRIWDDWARDKDDADPCDIYADEHTIDFIDMNRRIQFACKSPKFMQNAIGYGKPRCANEITMRFYDNKDFTAAMLPRDAGEQTRRVVSSLTSFRDECRIGRNGLVKLENHFLSEFWDIPLAQDVFFGWLKDRGWEPELSTPGLIAKQLYSQAEGAMRLFKNHDLLRLLDEMNRGPMGEREKTVGEVKNRLNAMSRYGDLYEALLVRKIFRLGSKVKCPHCSRKEWYGLANLNETIVCPKCLNSFDALGRVDEGQWCYKTTGPFSIPGHADGGFCSLFAIEQLSHKVLNMEVTPVLSFTAHKQSGQPLEADFGVLWRQIEYGVVHEGVVFGECKSYNDFQTKDIQRMQSLADQFPGAVLAFCTLKNELSAKEKRLISRIAKRGRTYWKHEKPKNPVLILTERELFAEFSIPQAWSGLTEAKQFEHAHGLLEICDATQQFYLGLPSWHQTWHEHWERRRKKKAPAT